MAAQLHTGGLMITLNNINSYEPASGSIMLSFLSGFTEEQLKNSLWGLHCFRNYQVMGIDFLKKECTPSALGEAFDAAYPDLRSRLAFFIMLSTVCGANCRPRQADWSRQSYTEVEESVNCALSGRRTYLEDLPIEVLAYLVHFTHERIKGVDAEEAIRSFPLELGRHDPTVISFSWDDSLEKADSLIDMRGV
jgi:hypothetical protein